MNTHQPESKPPEPSLRMMNCMMMFFSEIAISATHDMKNHLAIINENTGLLEDLLHQDLTRTLAQNRDKKVTETIRRQVERSDQILKKLNRFAHNLASENAVTDIETALILVLDLCSGIIRNHAVEIKIIPPENRIYLGDPPFLLNLLLFRAVQTSMSAADGDKILTISFAPALTGPSLRFSMTRVRPGGLDELFTRREEIELTRFLNVKVNKNIKNGFALEWKKQR